MTGFWSRRINGINRWAYRWSGLRFLSACRPIGSLTIYCASTSPQDWIGLESLRHITGISSPPAQTMTIYYDITHRKLDHQDEVVSALRDSMRLASTRHSQTRAMAGLITATSALSIKNIDLWENLFRWETLSAQNSRSRFYWKFWSRTAPDLPWIDLCSGNGFQREKALCKLSGPAPNLFFLVLAIRRLNDWVPQVREAARKALPSLAKTADPAIVADALCAILPHWMTWERMEDKDWPVFAEILSVEAIRSALMRKITQSSAGPMATILAQVGRTDAFDDGLSEIARYAVQPSVRAKAYRCLLEGKMTWVAGRTWQWTDIRYCKGKQCPIIATRPLKTGNPFMATLMSAIHDRSPFVRRVAGEMVIRDYAQLGPTAITLAERLALDPYPSIAERGKFVLKMLNE